jgi:hypothetical protein
MRVYPALMMPPPEFHAPIGLIVTLWAHEEWLLKMLAFELAGLDPKRGRAIFREPRTEDYPTMFEQLLRLKGEKPPEQLGVLRKAIEKAKPYRDLLAHGAWGVDEAGRHFIQKTKGHWELKIKPVKRRASVPRLSRNEVPEAIFIGLEELERIKQFVLEVLDLTTMLRLSLGGVLKVAVSA